MNAGLSSENARKTPDKRSKNANLNAALVLVLSSGLGIVIIFEHKIFFIMKFVSLHTLHRFILEESSSDTYMKCTLLVYLEWSVLLS